MNTFEMEGSANDPKQEQQNVPTFETLADALPEEERESFLLLSEQVEDIAKSHGGRIDDGKLTSAERALVDQLKEMKARAFENIRMAE